MAYCGDYGDYGVGKFVVKLRSKMAYCGDYGDYGVGKFVVKLRSKIHANLCNILL
jgi:hypothetical protein